MYEFKSDLNEHDKKVIIEYNVIKERRKFSSRLFWACSYYLVIIFICCKVGDLTVFEVLQFNGGFIGYIFLIVLIIMAFEYIGLMNNIMIYIATIDLNLDSLVFMEDSIKIMRNKDSYIVPINSFSKVSCFDYSPISIGRIIKKFLLQVGNITILKSNKTDEESIIIENYFNEYKKQVTLIKNVDINKYITHYKIVNKMGNEIIQNIFSYITCFKSQYQFDIFLLIIVITDFFTVNIGLWIFILIRMLLFFLLCLFKGFAYSKITKNTIRGGQLYFNDDGFAVFSGKVCILYGNKKEIISIKKCGKYKSVNTLKGRFVVEDSSNTL